jgi:hypothetical protein
MLCFAVPNLAPWYRTLNSPVRDFEKTRTEFQEILAKPIRELGLKLEGSPLEPFVQQLYRELDAKGLHKFRPLVISPMNGDALPASPS